MRRRVDRRYAGFGAYGGVDLRSHLLWRIQCNCRWRLFACQRVGQHGLGVKTAAVGGDDSERRFLVELAQFFGDVVTGEAAAENNDGMHEKWVFVK